jgi:hypothetical protein
MNKAWFSQLWFLMVVYGTGQSHLAKNIYGLPFFAVRNDVDGVAQFSGKRVTYGEE